MFGRVAWVGASVALSLLATHSLADPLTAQEVRDFMLGVKMSGVLVETNEQWFECISPNGETVYNIEGQISTGFVEIDEDGRTCFTYPRATTTSTSCFTVEEQDGKKVFVEVASKLRFRVDELDPTFDDCPISAPVS